MEEQEELADVQSYTASNGPRGHVQSRALYLLPPRRCARGMIATALSRALPCIAVRGACSEWWDAVPQITLHAVAWPSRSLDLVHTPRPRAVYSRCSRRVCTRAVAAGCGIRRRRADHTSSKPGGSAAGGTDSRSNAAATCPRSRAGRAGWSGAC